MKWFGMRILNTNSLVRGGVQTFFEPRLILKCIVPLMHGVKHQHEGIIRVALTSAVRNVSTPLTVIFT